MSSSLMKQVWNYIGAANYAVTITICLAIMQELTEDMIGFPYWSMICFFISSTSSSHAMNNKLFLCIFIISFSLGSGLLGWFALTNTDMKKGNSSLTFADLKFNVMCSVIARCLFDVVVCSFSN